MQLAQTKAARPVITTGKKMIPIKKLKKQIMAEFEKSAVIIELKVQSLRIANKIRGHYLKIPYGLEDGTIIAIRWNVSRGRFDKITFPAFGKLHNIKL